MVNFVPGLVFQRSIIIMCSTISSPAFCAVRFGTHATRGV